MKPHLNRTMILIAVVLAGAAVAAPAQEPREPAIRIGIIGADTSHVTAFTRVLNDPSYPDHVPGARVVAVFPGGSPDVPASRDRIEKFTAELRDRWKIEVVKDIPSLLSKVDAVLLESVDGRRHLEQVKPVFAARKPVFIDKPLAASYRDAKEIARLGKEAGVPWWSSSSLRFAAAIAALKRNSDIGAINGAATWGPATLEPTNPGLFWYGIHATEILFALMGGGCVEVTAIHTEGTDAVTCRWQDGRIGTVRGLRKGKEEYGAVVYGEKGIRHTDLFGSGYRPMLVEIIRFFQTRRVPVPNDETLEVMAFMEAAEASRKRGGAPVKLAELE